MDVAFLDFSKAFNRLSHSESDRRWWKRSNRQEAKSVNSRCIFILVGSLLWGPSGFLAGMPSAVLTGVTMALYADDCKS